jgi:hypothetical protein
VYDVQFSVIKKLNNVASKHHLPMQQYSHSHPGFFFLFFFAVAFKKNSFPEFLTSRSDQKEIN